MDDADRIIFNGLAFLVKKDIMKISLFRRWF